MVEIDKSNKLFTVIFDVSVDPSEQGELLAIMSRAAPVFARQPGFVSSSLHRSRDGSRVLNYLQWRTQADHEACMTSAEVAAAGKDFMTFAESGRARFEVRTYELADCFEAPDG